MPGTTCAIGRARTNWKKLLQDPGDLLVAAGGDGTVRKVAIAAADAGVPFAALPIGTANNIAKTLGLLGDARDLVRSWDATGPAADRPRRGAAPATSRGDSSRASAAGWIAELHRSCRRGRRRVPPARARDRPRPAPARGPAPRRRSSARWRIVADGLDLSGDYLAVEILNIRFVGPNVPLAPDADPSDGLLDVVLVDRGRPRPAFSSTSTSGCTSPSGEMPPLRSVRAREIRLGGARRDPAPRRRP